MINFMLLSYKDEENISTNLFSLSEVNTLSVLIKKIKQDKEKFILHLIKLKDFN